LEEVHYETTIPTVQDRFIQQLLLQVLTPIFDPQFSEHSYGFRPGRSAQDAVRAAQQYAQGGKEWVVDLDITKFLDRVPYCPLVIEKAPAADRPL
jgi:RNA-directed DNA polymerase